MERLRLRRAANAVLGAAPGRCTPLHGGDLSDVVRLTFPDGRQAVAKTGPLVAQEARMMRAMAKAGAPVPAILGIHAETLLMEALEETPASPAGWRALGDGLARLHAATGAAYGWAESYAFGPVPIANAPADDWPTFWADRRLRVFLPDLPCELARRVETLANRLPEHLPRHPRPALLHGDLWQGNALFSGRRAFLIDPACYHGDPAVDLAMLKLFGTVPGDFWEGYGAPQARALHPVYQLWPALVHLRLFGPGYRGLVERCLAAAGV